MVAQRISRRTVVDWDRQRQPPAQAVQLCDEMGRQRAAVARSKRPHVGVPGTERRPLPNALGGERRGDAIFAAHALLHQEFPLPMGRFASSSSTDGTTTVRQAPGSPANFAVKTRRSPTASSRSVLARRAPRVTKMLVGSTTWLITPCAVRSGCNQNPSRPASKQLTTSIDASSGGSSRWRRPAMKASSPAPSPASRR
jgi:hypothetical protein